MQPKLQRSLRSERQLEAESASATALSEALSEAAELARVEVLRIAQEREDTWGATALRRLEAARSKLVKSISDFEARAGKFDAAWTELALAGSHEWRDRVKQPRLANHPDVDAWREWAAASTLSEIAAEREQVRVEA